MKNNKADKHFLQKVLGEFYNEEETLKAKQVFKRDTSNNKNAKRNRTNNK